MDMEFSFVIMKMWEAVNKSVYILNAIKLFALKVNFGGARTKTSPRTLADQN